MSTIFAFSNFLWLSLTFFTFFASCICKEVMNDLQQSLIFYLADLRTTHQLETMFANTFAEQFAEWANNPRSCVHASQQQAPANMLGPAVHHFLAPSPSQLHGYPSFCCVVGSYYYITYAGWLGYLDFMHMPHTNAFITITVAKSNEARTKQGHKSLRGDASIAKFWKNNRYYFSVLSTWWTDYIEWTETLHCSVSVMLYWTMGGVHWWNGCHHVDTECNNTLLKMQNF